MTRVRYGELEVTLQEGETVLAALERAGARVASSCRIGACQACLLRAEAGDPGAKAQEGLRPAQRERGFFLACVSRPSGDLEVATEAAPRIAAEVAAVEDLGAAVVRVRVRVLEDIIYRAGQYVQVERADGLVRAYSLASVPAEDSLLELHVRVHPQGQMSRWLAAARPGTPLHLRGPSGECFYTEGRPEQPILLAGTGTGLAPLLGIARDALRRGHTGPLTLVHGAREPGGLYAEDVLRDMCSRHPNLRVVRCALAGAAAGVETGDVVEVAVRAAAPLKGARVFLCGGPEQVAALRKRCFLAGASLKEISADAFHSAPAPASA